MKQIPLLTIEAPSTRAIVRDRLNGFKYRQAARDDRRKRERERDAARRVLNRGRRQPKQTSITEETETNMQQIRVVYRATFRQLKGKFALAADIHVEVFETKDMWHSRSAETGVSFGFVPAISADAAKQEAESRFVTKVKDWQMYGKVVNQFRLIRPEEVVTEEDKIFLLTLDDFTHIVDPHCSIAAQPDAKIYPACGESPSLKQIISLKANIAPTCPKCAEVYRKLGTFGRPAPM